MTLYAPARHCFVAVALLLQTVFLPSHTVTSRTDVGCELYASSPRPTGAAEVYVVSHGSLSPAELLTLDTLAGVLARRDAPRLFRVSDSDCRSEDCSDIFWLRRLETVYSVATNYSYSHVRSVVRDVVAEFRHALRGFVRFQPNIDGSVNAALMFCAAEEAFDAAGRGLLAVGDSATAAYLEDVLGLAMVRDAREVAEAAAYSELVARNPRAFRAGAVAFQTGQRSSGLADYAVFAALPTLEFGSEDDGPTNATIRVVEDMRQRRKDDVMVAFGWGPEHPYVDFLSRRGAYVHASDLTHNLAGLSNVHVHAGLQRHSAVLEWLGRASSAAGTQQEVELWHPSPREPEAVQIPPGSKHTVAFVMTDGDNIQFLINAFCTDRRFFAAPERGSFPLGWTVSPALATLAPAVAQYLWESATQNDSFVAGPSGAGYAYPDAWGNCSSSAAPRAVAEQRRVAMLRSFSAQTAALMTQSGLRILNVIGSDDLGPASDIPVQALSLLVGDAFAVDMVLYYSYGACYSGLQGRVAWTTGPKAVPILTARASLWGSPAASGRWEGASARSEGRDDRCREACTECGVDRLVRALDEPGLVTDRSSPRAYSVVPVHAWSHNVSDVKRVAEALEATGRFDVVTPAVLSRRFLHSVKPPASETVVSTV